MVNDKQLEANQENAQLGGVKSNQGKEVSKFNATKHGILRESITDYEQDFYTNLLSELEEELKPKTIIECMIVERIVIHYLKLFRLQRAETEFMKSTLNPHLVDFGEITFGTVREEGYEPKINETHIDRLSSIYSRYETTIENRLFRAIHELERIQRIRRGEKVTAPITADINQLGSFGETNA